MKPLFSIPIEHCLYCLYWKKHPAEVHLYNNILFLPPSSYYLKFKFISVEMSIGFSQSSLDGQYRSISSQNNTFCQAWQRPCQHWIDSEDTRGKQTNEESDERVISGKDRAVEIRPDRRSHPFQNVTKLWTKSIAPPYLCTFSGMICR